MGRPPKLNVDPPGTSHAINNTTFFEWDPAAYNAYFNKIKDAHDFTIPKLNEMACEQVEIASVPYVSFVATKTADSQAANYRSCCAVTSSTGSATSGPSSTASS